MSYLNLLARNRRLLGFGFTVAFCSSFGQTFFISLFSPGIRADLGLSSGAFGLLYSVATLASAALLVWSGRLIDRVDLRHFTLGALSLMVAAAFLMVSAESLPVLALAIFLLRQSGQGLMSHIAVTSMARYFDAARGKAVSIAAFGFPAGEAVLPLAAVALSGAIGWRQSWLVIALIVLCLLAPLLLWLLKGQKARHDALLAEQERSQAVPRMVGRHWRDPRFYLVLPALLAPAFVITGFFFHQAHLAAEKGWSLTWLASCFVVFAVAQGLAALQGGALVDRFGARRVLPFLLVPMALALITLAAFDQPVSALFYMALLGITSGLDSPVEASLWAELYGVLDLGAIRALAAALGVLASAFSPVLLGALIDLSVGVPLLALGCLAYTVFASLLVLPVTRKGADGKCG